MKRDAIILAVVIALAGVVMVGVDAIDRYRALRRDVRVLQAQIDNVRDDLAYIEAHCRILELRIEAMQRDFELRAIRGAEFVHPEYVPGEDGE